MNASWPLRSFLKKALRADTMSTEQGMSREDTGRIVYRYVLLQTPVRGISRNDYVGMGKRLGDGKS